MLLPPQGDAVAAEFAGVVGGVEVDGRLLAGHVVDAVRDQLALPGAGEVVVERLHRLLGVGLAAAVEVPQQFLLLRVDADHRVARRLGTPAAAARCSRTGRCDRGGGPSSSSCAPCGVRASASAAAGESSGGWPACPAPTSRRDSSRSDRFVHSTPSRIGSPAVNSCSSCRRLASRDGQVAVSGRRPPPFSDPVGGRVLGRLPGPRGPVESSSDRSPAGGRCTRRRRGPSLAASTAAYRRRSFSDSQPNSRFIFASTSAG